MLVFAALCGIPPPNLPPYLKVQPKQICESESCSVVSDFSNHMDYTVHGILQARILECVAFPLSRGSSEPWDRTPVSHITGIFFLPAEPPGKPRNTEVGSLSLLQGICLTQESNRGLLHCRQILCQLSLQGSSSARSH